MRRQWIILTVIATALVLVAASCTPAVTLLPPPTTAPLPAVVPTAPPSPTTAPLPSAVPTTPPSPTAATAANAFPTGVFTNPVGWTFEFKADGREVFQGGGTNAWGTYTVTGNQILFKESSDACALDAQEGTYTWVYDGKALSFKVLDDRCGGREGSLTSGAWTRKP